MKCSRRAQHRQQARRGGAYILVLVTTAIVTMVSLTSAAVWRTRLMAAQVDQDRARAQHNAVAALDLGLYATRTNNWRSRGSVWMSDVAFSNGLMSLYASDPTDGDLTDDEMDPVRLRAVGRSGIAREVIEAVLEAVPQPLDSLESGLHAGAGLTLNGATVVSDQPVTTNGGITATSSSVSPGVESVGLITALSFTGSRRAPAPSRSLPAVADMAGYLASATLISGTQLPNVGGVATLENVLLSPAHNPFGASNALGRYVIDAGGLSVRIANSRVYGMLIIRNAASATIEGSVSLEASSPMEPVLLVQGPIQIAMSDAPLAEGNTRSWNPPGAPYKGNADTDMSDELASSIIGLVFISGNATFSGNSTVHGPVLVGGTASVSGRLTLRNDLAWLASPPSGFRSAPLMRIASGSVMRATD